MWEIEQVSHNFLGEERKVHIYMTFAQDRHKLFLNLSPTTFLFSLQLMKSWQGKLTNLMLHQAKRQKLLRKDTDFRVLTYTMTHMPYAVLLDNVWSKELREGSAEILYCHFISKELHGGRKLPTIALAKAGI